MLEVAQEPRQLRTGDVRLIAGRRPPASAVELFEDVARDPDLVLIAVGQHFVDPIAHAFGDRLEWGVTCDETAFSVPPHRSPAGCGPIAAHA